jgi:hypothetical protein
MMCVTLCRVSTQSIPSLRENEIAKENRSSISGLSQKKSVTLLAQVQQRDLSDFDVVALILNAMVLSDGLIATVTLGIGADKRRIFGFSEGNNQNQQVCEGLLGNLRREDFKIPAKRRLLAVLDSSPVLKIQAHRISSVHRLRDACLTRCAT